MSPLPCDALVCCVKNCLNRDIWGKTARHKEAYALVLGIHSESLDSLTLLAANP